MFLVTRSLSPAWACASRFVVKLPQPPASVAGQSARDMIILNHAPMSERCLNLEEATLFQEGISRVSCVGIHVALGENFCETRAGMASRG
jgi:hypothetical protein